MQQESFDPPRAGAPIYATYPKPEWFVEAFDATVLNAWLAAPRAPHMHGAVAIEVRLPAPGEPGCLCGASDCTRDDACFDGLGREMALYRATLGAAPIVCDLRWSSGCSMLAGKALKGLHRALAESFDTQPNQRGNTARIDPLAQQRDVLPALAKLGVDSLQIGAETTCRLDAHTAAQAAKRTATLVAAARDAGFAGVEAAYRIDAPERLGASPPPALDALIAAGPTRIALHDALPADDSAGAAARIEVPAAIANAAARLAQAGYVCIAESLFALAPDPYAIAHRQGRLSCRAGGYAARPVGTVLGLGPGAIGQVGPFYYQNHRAPARYLAALDAGRLPIERGLHLSPDELVRRAVISSLETNLFVDVPTIEAAYGIEFERAFAPELRQLRHCAKAGLLTIDATGITLTQPGRLACGAICRVFDARGRQLIERTPQTTLL
jgi:oxygen-independent coproporphyrinogen-3 oxidase